MKRAHRPGPGKPGPQPGSPPAAAKENAAWELVCPTPAAFRPLAAALAPLLQLGDVLLLHGALGAGKTSLVQVLAEALGVQEDQYVSSPSFALLHEYQGRLPLYHMDFYRLQDHEEVEAAGLLEPFAQPGICLVEWPDRLNSLPCPTWLDIELQPNGNGGRFLRLIPHGADWVRRLRQIAPQVGLRPAQPSTPDANHLPGT